MQAWMANNIIFKQLQKNITVFLRSKMISKVAKVWFSNDMKCQDLLNRSECTVRKEILIYLTFLAFF